MSELKIQCSFNDQKYKMADVAGIEKEANREMEEGKYNNYVDLERSHKNVYFKRTDDWLKVIQDAKEKYNMKHNQGYRDNSVVLMGTVVSAGEDWLKNADRETIISYFKDAYEFMCEERGEVINAVVHFDETNPHMHVSWLPILHNQPLKKPSGKKGEPWKQAYDKNGKPLVYSGFNFKKLNGTRYDMSNRQTALYERVGKKYGLERGEYTINSKERKRHLTEVEFKVKKETEKLQALQTESNELDVEIERKKVTRKSLNKGIKGLEQRLNDIQTQIANGLIEKDRLLEELQRIQIDVQCITQEREQLQLERDKSKRENETLKSELKAGSDRLKKLEERENAVKSRAEELMDIDKPNFFNSSKKIKDQYERIALEEIEMRDRVTAEVVERVTAETKLSVTESVTKSVKSDLESRYRDDIAEIKKDVYEGVKTQIREVSNSHNILKYLKDSDKNTQNDIINKLDRFHPGAKDTFKRLLQESRTERLKDLQDTSLQKAKGMIDDYERSL